MIDYLKSIMNVDLINLGLIFVKYIYYIKQILSVITTKNKRRKSKAKQIDLHIGKGDFILDFHLNR